MKIPAWLAPLARETDPAGTPGNGRHRDRQGKFPLWHKSGRTRLSRWPSSLHEDSPTMFGGQLLGVSSESSEPGTSGGSKKGLLIGIAAAGILLLGGGAWYAKQPGSALSTLLAPKPVVTQAQTVQNSPAASVASPRFVRRPRRQPARQQLLQNSHQLPSPSLRPCSCSEFGCKSHSDPRRRQRDHLRPAQYSTS